VSFEKFFEFYWPRLVRYLKSQANNVSWAEDVADEAMIAVWDKWESLLTFDRPDSYLFTVAIHRLRRLEARAREDCCLDEDLASTQRNLRIAAIDDKWVADHLDLVAALQSLPRRQSEVLCLHYLCGYTLAETAQILRIGEGTVKKHLHRGLESIRQHHASDAAQALTRGIPV